VASQPIAKCVKPLKTGQALRQSTPSPPVTHPFFISAFPTAAASSDAAHAMPAQHDCPPESAFPDPAIRAIMTAPIRRHAFAPFSHSQPSLPLATRPHPARHPARAARLPSAANARADREPEPPRRSRRLRRDSHPHVHRARRALTSPTRPRRTGPQRTHLLHSRHSLRSRSRSLHPRRTRATIRGQPSRHDRYA